MLETDLQRIQGMVADISDNGRISVSGCSHAFMLHSPAVEVVGCGDFRVSGRRRRHTSEGSVWQQAGVVVTKLLAMGKRRIVIQDLQGRVLTLAAVNAANETEVGEEVKCR